MGPTYSFILLMSALFGGVGLLSRFVGKSIMHDNERDTMKVFHLFSKKEIDEERDRLRERTMQAIEALGLDLSEENESDRMPVSRDNYINGGWTRYEAFSQILHDHPPREDYREGDIVVLNVLFKADGHTYCYRAKDDVYKAGDIVEVTVRGTPKAVVVDSVGYYSMDEYPFDAVPLNYINGMAAGDLKKKYQEALEEELGDEAEREAIREEAAKELSAAKTEKAKAMKQKAEAEQIQAEANRMKADAQDALKEATVAYEKARYDEELREAAEKEAAKTWKRNRPETNNVTILRLREVQDALDEDEQIYRKLSALEDKMSKVIEKSEEMIDDDNLSNTTNLIRRLHAVYLPKTISVLEQYKNIFSSGLPPKNVEDLRNGLLEAIDKSEEVYNNVLTSLYEKDMMELTVEMEVLKTMFALSGLLDSDFDIKG